MKKILCFGDSNTYGFNPIDGSRYSSDIRWAGILKNNLRGKYKVVEAGSNNRTCFIDNPDGEEKTGYKALPKYLSDDIDVLIIALGINDIQKFFNPDLFSVKKGIINLVEIARKINPNIKILLLSPSCLDKCLLDGYFSIQFDEESIKKSFKMAEIYNEVAKEFNCDFINLDLYVKVSKIDGLHYSPESHRIIAKLLQDYFLNLT